ncbi:G5 domain-containing protein [Herbiconiux sp. CPCC 205763]|uniref:G5 domain-containing protein n=1 Tax=Herbiconiux aconitum TaxID=2970913 RepID=A0ABT2GUW2_9MICO|nr:G5 domain-containing protein [Herbiconiux aconitum]MCS5720011.1 G5 domain-containing protein [Herbiconiux aconitum]
MTTALPPAGWFPDPHDATQQRWWDGTTWTEFTTAWATTAGDPAVTPQEAPGTTVATAPARWRPTPLTWTVGAIAVVCGIVILPTLGIGGFLVAVSLFALGAGIWTIVKRRPSWLNLSPTRGAGAAVLGISFAILLLGSLIAIPPQQSSSPETANIADAIDPVAGAATEPSAAAHPKKSSSPTATTAPTPAPVKTTQMVDVPEPIAFAQESYEEPTLDIGTNAVVTAGAQGTKISRWEIALVDGVEVSRVLISETVTVPPVNEVTAVGTRQPPPAPEPESEQAQGDGCDPNYEWGCVPIASDVDCPGGSGNGPAYAPGTVHVIGNDIYDLDRDGDGIACD